MRSVKGCVLGECQGCIDLFLCFIMTHFHMQHSVAVMETRNAKRGSFRLSTSVISRHANLYLLCESGPDLINLVQSKKKKKEKKNTH